MLNINKKYKNKDVLKWGNLLYEVKTVEEMTYIAGYALESLRKVGCPMNNEVLMKIVDKWANGLPTPTED